MTGELSISSPTVQALVREGIVKVLVKESYRNPLTTEAPVKAKQGLVGQCNLRNQHYNLPARAHHLLDHREIHLCFSAAGHPVNQVGFMHPRRQIRGNPVMYFLLAGI